MKETAQLPLHGLLMLDLTHMLSGPYGTMLLADLGPRDWLQSQRTQVSTEGKWRLILALFDAGLPSMEATSFVSPKAVPQMANADILLPSVSVPVSARLSALVPNLRRLDLALRMSDAAGEMVLADTIGAASPAQVQSVLATLSERIDASRIGVHFHDTRGMALANAWAALELGIRRFDASIGGLGGCPFAPGAAGNLATEDLVLMAHRSGYGTGIDVQALRAAIAVAQELVGYAICGRSARWLASVARKHDN